MNLLKNKLACYHKKGKKKNNLIKANKKFSQIHIDRKKRK